MTAQNINLRSIIDDEVLQSRFYHDDTVLDLRKRFAKDQGYEDDYENITFYGLCFELPDEKLVREMAEAEGGISYKIAPCLTVVSDANIFAIFNGGQPNLLVKDVEELRNLGHKRHVLDNFYGRLALIRNKYAHT